MRKLVYFPIAFALTFLLLEWLTPTPEAKSALFRGEIELAKAVAFAGCLGAAFSLERGAYLRGAWLCHGVAYALLLVRDATFAPLVAAALHASIDYVRSALVMVVNTAAVIGTIRLSRAWHVAGIELPGAARGRVLGFATTSLLALVLTGPAALVNLRALAQGNVASLVGLSSDIGDIVQLCLIAPILLTAVAMRGGLLRWPWGLMTASMAAWVLYDAAPALVWLDSLDPLDVRIAKEIFRSLACTLAFSAALAQRLVVERGADAR